MKVTVYHKDFDTKGAYNRVAVVYCEGITDEKEACEYAYRWTQNIHDSWSHPEGVKDKNENVYIVGELPTRNGRKFGLRSSMMGDRFYISNDGGSGSVYDCAMIGFDKVPAREEV